IVNQDVTERTRAEEALHESANRLQHLSRRLLAVQEEERRHLSRELHDEFGQLLASITLHLHAARRVAGEAAHAALDECMALLHHAGEQVRTLALELRPRMLETAGLDATLRWLAEQHQQRTGITTEVVGELNDVPSERSIACFRVAQEALTNVARHARAQRVWIELDQSDGKLGLTIRDDGVGFDVARAFEQAGSRGNLGLSGMRERVEILGGNLEVDSGAGRGTRIRISLPNAPLVSDSAERAA
ncbi:MAG: sensor histidine kinase, partial [Gammaproteobacteria bacterium]